MCFAARVFYGRFRYATDACRCRDGLLGLAAGAQSARICAFALLLSLNKDRHLTTFSFSAPVRFLTCSAWAQSDSIL